MPTEPIDYFTATYGDPAWTTLELTWDGTATTYTLFQVGNTVSLNVGPEKSFTFEGSPDTRYDFRVETELSVGKRVLALTAYTSILPPPSGFSVTDVTSTSISLGWQQVTGATSYEVADVTDAYNVIYSGGTTAHTVTGIAPNTKRSYAVRTVLGEVVSKWSRPVTEFTDIPANITPGVYTFAPVSTSVWAAGRVGASTPAWRPAADDYYHGDGWVWGDTYGSQSTYFFYGSPNPFLPIAGATPTKLEIYIARDNASGDPAVVLSQWFLHGYASKPAGDPLPSESTTVYDAGLLARGQSGWIELPAEWAAALVTNGAHKGIAWGNTAGRYQVVDNAPGLVPPLPGTLRITVN